VPDQAVAQFNFRASDPQSIEDLTAQVAEARARVEREFEVSITWHGEFSRPPRVPDHRVMAMESALEGCLTDLEEPFSWRDTGGGTDGSLLLDYGLPNIDSLGVRGANLHSDREYMILQSLIERIHLTTLFLIRVAGGEIDSAALT
jgi:glutamate carboxypeptidase